MRKLLASATLIAAVAAFSLPVDSTALAQDKKKDKETKKDKDKVAGKADSGSIEIHEGKDGKFRYTVRDADGKFLALSAAYPTEKDARKGIDELKHVIAKAKVTVGEKKEKEKKTDK